MWRQSKRLEAERAVNEWRERKPRGGLAVVISIAIAAIFVLSVGSASAKSGGGPNIICSCVCAHECGGGCGSSENWENGANVAPSDSWGNKNYFSVNVLDYYNTECGPYSGTVSASILSNGEWWFSLINQGLVYENVLCISLWVGGTQTWSAEAWGGIAPGEGAPDGCSTSVAPNYGGGNVAGDASLVGGGSWNVITSPGTVDFTEVSWYLTDFSCAQGDQCANAQSSSLSISVSTLG